MAFGLLAAAALACSCGRGPVPVRVHNEIHVRAESPEAAAGDHPTADHPAADNPEADHDHPAGGHLGWDTPPGWQESAGTGMRLASFEVAGADATGNCTIITLSGAAGGLEANVKRWIGQLGLPAPDDEEFRRYLDGQESFTSLGGLPGILVDLTVLSEAHPEAAESMLAGVITAGAQTVFVKFTGPLPLLKEERARFAALCSSIGFQE